MVLIRNAALFAVVGCLMMVARPADAANAKARRVGANTIHGVVVKGKGKPVAGAHVHVAHHHKRAGAGAAKAKPAVAKPKAGRVHAHHGIVTAANGTFTLKHRKAGTVEVVAHKKHVGTGHARVTVGKTGNVTIRLHKLHHHHT